MSAILIPGVKKIKNMSLIQFVICQDGIGAFGAEVFFSGNLRLDKDPFHSFLSLESKGLHKTQGH